MLGKKGYNDIMNLFNIIKRWHLKSDSGTQQLSTEFTRLSESSIWKNPFVLPWLSVFLIYWICYVAWRQQLLLCCYFQHVEFHINKGVLGLNKEVSHIVWEFQGPSVAPHSTRSFHDLHKSLQVPVMPPTLAEVCKLIELYYVVKVSIPVWLCLQGHNTTIYLR